MDERILVVDDEKDICEILGFNLSNEGYRVDTATSAEEALRKLTPEHALILLDVMMGGMSGYKMAEKLRHDGNRIPIIFLTAKDTENDMLTGFSVGGDDYIPKPFSIKEVVARVKAVLKRSAGQSAGPGQREGRLVFGDVTIDFDTKEVIIGPHAIPLTRTEFDIIRLLAEHPRRVFTRDALARQVWGYADDCGNKAINIHVMNLRRKLGADSVDTVRGVGYRAGTRHG